MSRATRVGELDISKVFYKVWHAGLLHKLKSYETSGWVFGLISSLLSTTWLRVVLGGKSLQEYSVNAGVAQGSLLGPTLFLLYINDFPGDSICEVAIYADDTILSTLTLTRHLICNNNQSWLLNLNLTYESL